MTTVTSIYNIKEEVTYTTLNGTFLGYDEPSRDIELDYEWSGRAVVPVMTKSEVKFAYWDFKFAYEGTDRKAIDEQISADLKKMLYSEITFSDGFKFRGAVESSDVEFIGIKAAKVTYRLKGSRISTLSSVTLTKTDSTYRGTVTPEGNAQAPATFQIEIGAGQSGFDFDWGIGLSDGYISGAVLGQIGTTFTGTVTVTINGATGAVYVEGATSQVHIERIYDGDLPKVEGGYTSSIYLNDNNDEISEVELIYEGRWL